MQPEALAKSYPCPIPKHTSYVDLLDFYPLTFSLLPSVVFCSSSCRQLRSSTCLTSGVDHFGSRHDKLIPSPSQVGYITAFRQRNMGASPGVNV